MDELNSNWDLQEDDNIKDSYVAVSTSEIDTAAQLMAEGIVEVDPVKAARVRNKIDWHILPLMCTLYWIQFMDKTTLGSAAILGIRYVQLGSLSRAVVSINVNKRSDPPYDKRIQLVGRLSYQPVSTDE